MNLNIYIQGVLKKEFVKLLAKEIACRICRPHIKNCETFL